MNTKKIYDFVCDYVAPTEKICEIGWVLVRKDYRRCHISEYMLKEIESIHLTSNMVSVATTHPDNIGAFSLFLKNGYKECTRNKHYGFDRVFFNKERCRLNITVIRNHQFG